MEFSSFPIHQNRQRLAALGAYSILDTPPERQFDRLARLAAKVCQTPMAAISLVDESRQWFKAVYGLQMRETDIAASFCKYTICNQGPFIVEDASSDPLFAENPLVTGDLHLRFYAGCPLTSPSGHVLGALIVLDRVPRRLTTEQTEDLETLAEHTMIALELRRQRLCLGESLDEGSGNAATLDFLHRGARRSGSWELTVWNRQTGWSKEAARMFGIPAGESPSLEDMAQQIRLRDKARWLRSARICMRLGVPMDIECAAKGFDGRDFHTRWLAVAERAADGRIKRLIGTVQEITPEQGQSPERQASAAFLEGAIWPTRLAELMTRAREAMIVTDAQDRIHFWNDGAACLFGWTVEEALGRIRNELLKEKNEQFADVVNILEQDREYLHETWPYHKNGQPLQVHSHLTLIRDGDSDAADSFIFHVCSDITQHREDQQKAYFYAFFDQVTQLPNRALLLERFRHGQEAGHEDAAHCDTQRDTPCRNRHYGALIFLDLDKFKSANDVFGREAGDLLLRQAASRLLATVRLNDTVARLGGDEFALMLENLGDDERTAALQAEEMAQKILEALSAPYQLQRHCHTGSASLGITLFHDHESSLDELLKQAEMAMYQSKAGGGNKACFFDLGMQRLVTQRALLEADLRHATVRQEFELYYQPQCREDGSATGVEALVRWHHPTRGLIYPGRFIEVAEETGIIDALGRWVLEAACAQQVEWRSRHHATRLSVAVNVSPRQFHQPDFVQQVTTILHKTGASPAQLKLELTESLLVADIQVTAEKMAALKRLGVLLALDDFGTGYSSLALLRELPIDQLKIDQSFVRNINGSSSDDKLVQCIVALAKSLNMNVVAEGVETGEQQHLLAEYGCDEFQGHLFGAALPAGKLRFHEAELLVG